MKYAMAAPNCVSATHAALFATAGTDRCSVCAELLASENEEASAQRGRGLLVWARGDERRYEEPELCPRCASAIGVTAFHRWEIEEDEG
jgi:hypothetical protein